MPAFPLIPRRAMACAALLFGAFALAAPAMAQVSPQGAAGWPTKPRTKRIWRRPLTVCIGRR